MKSLGQLKKQMLLSTEESKLSRVIKLMEWTPENENDLKNIFMFIGKEYLGKDFIIPKDRSDTITDLLKYFTGNESGFDSNKGIYLYGNYGIGKSALMATIQKTLAYCFPFSQNGFMIKSLEDIIDIYKTDGSLETVAYRRNESPKHFCINEFGKDINDKIYGTSARQIIHSLFMLRYQMYQELKLFTHTTSNYSPNEIDVEPIVMDRMVEMFNFIEIKGESFRK